MTGFKSSRSQPLKLHFLPEVQKKRLALLIMRALTNSFSSDDSEKKKYFYSTDGVNFELTRLCQMLHELLPSDTRSMQCLRQILRPVNHATVRFSVTLFSQEKK